MHEVLVHKIADLQRHAGHADILREQIDGSTGLLRAASNLPGGVDWPSYVDKLTAIAAGSDQPAPMITGGARPAASTRGGTDPSANASSSSAAARVTRRRPSVAVPNRPVRGPLTVSLRRARGPGRCAVLEPAPPGHTVNVPGPMFLRLDRFTKVKVHHVPSEPDRVGKLSGNDSVVPHVVSRCHPDVPFVAAFEDRAARVVGVTAETHPRALVLTEDDTHRQRTVGPQLPDLDRHRVGDRARCKPRRHGLQDLV